MKKHGNQIIKNILGTFCIPVGTFLIFQAICSIKGINLFDTSGHVLTFVRSAVIISFTSWALSLNLNSGRFDFSIGSIALLSSMIGAKLTISYQMEPIMMIVITVLAGAMLGLIAGGIYVILKLPPIITSLGVTLMFEAFSFIYSKGEGVLISTNLNLLVISSLKSLLIILSLGLIIIWFICNKTIFGFNMKALQHGQKTSVNTGINEISNALGCYVIAGALMGVVGCVNITTRGSASVALNFSSISTMFIAFLPMFLGGFIGRFSEEKIGICLGSITVAFITLGFVRLDISSSLQSLTNAVILLLFLIYLNNENKIKQIFTRGRKNMI